MYNIIIGRKTLNIFKAVLYSAYLCVKIPSNQGVISVFYSILSYSHTLGLVPAMFKPNSVIFYSIRRWDNTTAASFTIRGSRIHTVSALIRPLAPAIQDDVTRDGIALARISRLITIANILCSCVRVDLLVPLFFCEEPPEYVRTMEEEEGGVTSPLLLRQGQEKVYHPGCPGCANDRRKELQEGLPYKEFLYVWIICLATCKQALHSCVCLVSLYIFYTHTHKKLLFYTVFNLHPSVFFLRAHTYIYEHFAYLIPHISISCLI